MGFELLSSLLCFGLRAGKQTDSSQDMEAVAAPVRDGTGSVIAALGISGPASRMSADTLDKFVACVKRGAERLSRELGYREA